MALFARHYRGCRGLSAFAVAIAIPVLSIAPALAGGEIVRTEVSRADLSGTENTEVIVAKLEMFPGASIPKHFHHGDEHVVVIEGGSVTLTDGKVIEFATGSALHFPAREVHGGFTASGDGPLIVYTMHIVEKGKPLMDLVE